MEDVQDVGGRGAIFKAVCMSCCGLLVHCLPAAVLSRGRVGDADAVPAGERGRRRLRLPPVNGPARLLDPAAQARPRRGLVHVGALARTVLRICGLCDGCHLAHCHPALSLHPDPYASGCHSTKGTPHHADVVQNTIQTPWKCSFRLDNISRSCAGPGVDSVQPAVHGAQHCVRGEPRPGPRRRPDRRCASCSGY